MLRRSMYIWHLKLACAKLLLLVLTGTHGLYKLAAFKTGTSRCSSGLLCPVVLASLLVSTWMIPVALLLDVSLRQVFLLIEFIAKLPRLKWLRPGYVAAFRVQRFVHVANVVGLI